MASPVNFTKSGKPVSATKRGGIRVSQLGTLINGVLYQHPRLTLNRLRGRSVRVTNPEASLSQRDEMTASLGMGGVGQRGRSGRDVGSTKARGEA
jgi:hypothetical protein